MNYILPILLLIVSNIFMTLAWYGHLKLQDMHILHGNTPLYIIILISWGLAFMEYCFMIPANHFGFKENGGPFSLFQLKIIQEAITLIVFTIFTVTCFRGETLQWNHLVAFVFIFLAVFFVFLK